MRWQIVENKRKIASIDFESHHDSIEMGGEQVACVVTFGVENGKVKYERRFAFPNIRTQPNNTHSSYMPQLFESPIIFSQGEIFDKVEFDGVLTVFSHFDNIKTVRKFFPSVELPLFYEQIEIKNNGDAPIFPNWKNYKCFDTRLACEGYVYAECISDIAHRAIEAGEALTVLFTYSARFADSDVKKEIDPLQNRYARVCELMNECDIETGDPIVDTAFSFAKLRAGEGLCNTPKGLIHSPGGMSYYAAIWCNDQCEYAAPWFAFTGDKREFEAIENIYSWYYPYMNSEFSPIPSSIISCGRDYWNGAGDRGDAAMYLYGLSRVLLTQGRLPDDRQFAALEWCAEYIKRKTSADGVVISDCDELEGRISSGINLSTSSLAYGGLGAYAILLERMGRPTYDILALQSKIFVGIEKHFGGNVSGYETYHYHKGCDVIRAWNCLPVYMGIKNRATETLNSISDKLWIDAGCRSTEGEKVLWDRSALYYIATLFKADRTNEAWTKLREYCNKRLLGDHVPYAVEAYPEGDMRHLSGESCLLCRVFTDGMLNISFDKNGYIIDAHIPEAVDSIKVKNIYLDGGFKSFDVKR